jgi:hypothetical protein
VSVRAVRARGITCESQLMSAPRSIMPIWISKTMPRPPLAAYCIATFLSVVIDMKAPSMPPLTPCSLGFQNSGGSAMPETPR